MRNAHRIQFRGPLLLLVALAFLAGQSADGADPGLSDNAALQYWKAFSFLPALDADQDKLISNWKAVPLDAQVDRLLAESQNSLMFLHRGARLKRCDWGLDDHDGISMQLPHLAKSRTLALIGALDARRAFERGNIKVARQDAASIMALARHLGQDPFMICLVVNYALEDLVVDLVAPYVPELKFSHDEAVAMYNALPTPATLAQAIEHEKKIMGPSIIRQLREADRRKAGAWREAWNQMLQGSEASDGVKNVGSIRQAQALLDECFSEYDRLAQLVQLPQPEFETQYSEFERRIKATNALGAVLLPSINKLVARERSRTARMQLLLAAIAVVESGPESLANFKDPFGDGPFDYEKLDDGFQLGSQFLFEGKPVTVKFGR